MWRYRYLLFVAVCCMPRSASALLDRVTYIDIGVGLPELIALEAEVRVLPRWQVGFGYGLLPGGTDFLKPNLNVPQLNITGPQGVTLNLQTTTTFSFDALSPFIRFFPAENNFYFQFCYTMLQLKGNLSTSVTESLTHKTYPGIFGGTVTLTQAVPTLSIGNIFTSQLFFINLSLGVSMFYTTSVDMALTGSLPDNLGGQSITQQAINSAQTTIKNAINQASSQLKNQIDLIPSLNFAVGFVF